MYERPLRPDELVHYGVPGMKWGVRRYQPYSATGPRKSGAKGKEVGEAKQNTTTKQSSSKSNTHLEKIKRKVKNVDKEKLKKYMITGAKLAAGTAVVIASKGMVNPLASSAMIVAGRSASDKIVQEIGEAILKKR